MDDSLERVEEDEKGVELYHQLNALWAKAGRHACPKMGIKFSNSDGSHT